MAQAKDLNISPYYDDFDPSNNFYKVLFKPGFAVQARELTVLQSILQNQIEEFGSHIFKEGSIVIPGAPTYDNNFNAVKVNALQGGIDVSLYVDNLKGKVIEGETSGVTASVDFIALPDNDNVEDLTIYVKYINAGSSDPSRTVFLDGEALFAKENIVYGNTTIDAGTPVATLVSANATAIGSAASVAEGVYFIRGTFVSVSQQTIILDHYNNSPSYRVGLQINEQIIGPKDDPSLYDNAKGFSNYAAPGADRFKISLTLTKKLLTDKSDQDFFEILRLGDGQIRKIKTKTDYNIIRDYIAERTYEESGNYAIDSFDISVNNSLNNRLGNGGVFFSGQKTEEGNDPSDDLMCVKISGGEAYVRGYDVTTDTVTILDTDKPRDVEKISTANVPFDMGNLVKVNNVKGQPGLRKIVTLYDQLGSTGTEIGSARLYSLSVSSGTYEGDWTEWDMYLYDIQTNTVLTINQGISSTELPDTAHVKGKNSGAFGYATSSGGGSSSITLSQTSGTFIKGEQLIINGIDFPRTITEVTAHSAKSIKSIKQTTGVTGFTQTFTADAALETVQMPNGIMYGDISGTSSAATLSSPGNTFDGIQVGDIVKYFNTSATSGATIYNYARVSGVAGSRLEVDLLPIGSSLDNVYNGTTIATGSAEVWLGYTTLNKEDAGSLYAKMPNPNISSVDFSSSTLTVVGQIELGAGGVTGSASTISVDNLNDGGGVAISTAFFEGYDVDRYSVHYGGSTGIGTVTDSSFELLENGSRARFTGLIPSDNNTVINVTAKKQGIQSKLKTYERSNIKDIVFSKYSKSGSGINTSVNDGLTYNGNAYGLRVQDEQISLDVPDVVKVLSVYESLDGGQPSFDNITFSATANVGTNAIIGENIVGQSSNAIARIVTNNGSTPSSGGTNKLGIVYLNDRKFVNYENVVFEESNITTTIEGINTLDTDGKYQDVTKSFSLDKGQRDQFYDYSRLVRRSNTSVPSKRLLVVYDRYDVPATDNGDVFTVLSYDKARYLRDIPLIGRENVRATDTLDFRPRVTVFSSTTTSPFDFTSRTSAFNTAPKFLLASNESSLLGYDYYLGRIDKVYLSEYGILTIQKGQSSSDPRPPVSINNSMELATIILPPYLYNPDNAKIILTDNKRYTMRDIGVLEDRIENLEAVTTLSLLEISTESLTIQDASGRNRFKSGFFVDSFQNNEFVDLRYSAIQVEPDQQEVRPIIARNSLQNLLLPSTNIIDEEFDSSVNYELLDPNVQKTGNSVTLKYSEIDWIEQAYATRVENVNPFHVVAYTGSLTLNPTSDSWVRTIRLEDATINETREVLIEESLDEGSGRLFEQGVTDTVVRTQSVFARDIILDSGDELYMRSRNTEFTATALRSFNRHYQFLDGTSGVDFIPKLLEIATDSSLANYGSSGTFKVGETVKGYDDDNNEIISFRVAQSNHKFGQYNSPSTVYTTNPYTVEPLQSSYTSSSKILNVDCVSLADEAQGLYSGYVTVGARLVGQTDGAIAYVKDLKLITDNYGDLQGTFFLRDPNTDPQPSVVIRTGTKTYKLTSSPTNAPQLKGSNLLSTARVEYESRGIWEETQFTTSNITTVTTTRLTWRVFADPLAQSFSVGGNIEAPDPNVGIDDDEHGIYLTSVDLFFATKDTGNNPVIVEIRTLELGTPTRVALGNPVTLRPDDITVSTTGDIATNVKFPEPIYLPPGREYAVVVLAPTSNQYELWIARMGEDAVNLQSLPNTASVQYNQQWAIGSLFKSQNGSVWSPSQLEDMKLKFYKAKFTSTSGTAFFANPTLDVSNGYISRLRSNPIVTFAKSGYVGVTTFETGDVGISSLSPGRRIVGENGYVTAHIVGTGCSVQHATLTGIGSHYEAQVATTVNTFNVVGEGRDYKINITAAGGVITGFTTNTVGSGYTAGDVVGIRTDDTTGKVGSGALFTITNNGGLDTLYLSGIQGSNAASGSFKSGTDLKFYDDDGNIKGFTTGNQITESLSGIKYPADGRHFLVDQFDHGMYSNANKLTLSKIKGNVTPTVLTSTLASSDSTISVASTAQFENFEGIAVGVGSTGYVKVGSEIIGYSAIGSGSLTIDGRGIDDTLSESIYQLNSPVEKYELNGISLRRINKTHSIGSTDIGMDSYYVEVDRSVGGADRSSDIAGSPQLSFTADGFFGGAHAQATRNIQYDAVVPNFNVVTPSSVTDATATMRTVTGTSVDGNETSFIDNGFESVQLNSVNALNSPRIVCSKINETTYLSNIERNKSFTTGVKLTTANENVSPIIYTDISYTEFRSNRINNPISNYPESNEVKSPLYDPHAAIYVSKVVSLDKPADSLKVILSAYRNATSDFRVLYSLVRPDSSEVQQEFELFPGYDNLNDTTGDGFGNQVIDSSKNSGLPDAFVRASLDNQFLEYQFTADNVGEFTAYQIKIVMSGTNQAYAPRIKELRAIAIK